jgi:hypothetical protein
VGRGQLYVVLQYRHQQEFRINVGAGNAGSRFVDPYVLPPRLAVIHHRDSLLRGMSGLLENVPVAARERMWFMHDGVPAHFSPVVQDVFNNTYDNEWIGR